MKISFQKRFTKRLAKVPEPIRTKAVSQIDVFRADPFDPRLNNHALQGEFA